MTCARSSETAHWLQVARQFRSHGQLTSLACTGAVKCLRLGQLDKTASAWQAHAPAPGIRPAGSTVTNSCAPVQGTRVGQSGGYWRSSQEQLAAPGYLKRAKQGEQRKRRKQGRDCSSFVLRNGVHLFKRRHRMLFCVGLVSLNPTQHSTVHGNTLTSF